MVTIKITIKTKDITITETITLIKAEIQTITLSVTHIKPNKQAPKNKLTFSTRTNNWSRFMKRKDPKVLTTVIKSNCIFTNPKKTIPKDRQSII